MRVKQETIHTWSTPLLDSWLGEESKQAILKQIQMKVKSNRGIKMKEWKAKGSTAAQAGTRRAQLPGRDDVRVLIFLVLFKS